MTFNHANLYINIKHNLYYGPTYYAFLNYAAVLKNLAYYAQYYAREQTRIVPSTYCSIYVQVCINISHYISQNFRMVSKFTIII